MIHPIDSSNYKIFIFTLFIQLQVAKTVNRNLMNKVLIISMEHLASFAKQYKETVAKYAKSHFEDRGQFFTPNMVC